MIRPLEASLNCGLAQTNWASMFVAFGTAFQRKGTTEGAHEGGLSWTSVCLGFACVMILHDIVAQALVVLENREVGVTPSCGLAFSPHPPFCLTGILMPCASAC